MSSQPFAIYWLEYHGSINHVGLFIENGLHGAGTQYHVIGTIAQGMTFQVKPMKRSDDDISYVQGSKELLGLIIADNLERFEQICRDTPPPERQFDARMKRINPSLPLRRCGEWAQEVTARARAELIICHSP